MRFLKDTHIHFVKFSKTAAIASAILLLIGLISLLFIRGLNFGIDFTGGTLVQLRFERDVSTGEIRGALNQQGLGRNVIQSVSGKREYMIRIAEATDLGNVHEKIKTAVNTLDNPYQTLRTEKVGPKIGEELRRDALLAIISAILVIGVYISIRFQFRFALGAVIALIHDVLFTLGVFSIAQFEISLSTIAAGLTIVGYSLNDTIVLYDRIRENMKRNRRLAIDKLVNTSINETLSRTVITSLTTLVVVVVLAFSKGEVQIFAYAMIVGVFIGTYSSIYIAGPVIIAWQKRFSTKYAK